MIDFVDSWCFFCDDKQAQLNGLEKQIDNTIEKLGNLENELSELENKSGLDIYVINKGDTLTSIAKEFNSTSKELANINRIKNPDLIYAGHKILVPPKFAVVNPAEKLADVIKESGMSIEPKKKTIKYVTTYVSKPIWHKETGHYIHLELGKYIEVEEDTLATTKHGF